MSDPRHDAAFDWHFLRYAESSSAVDLIELEGVVRAVSARTDPLRSTSMLIAVPGAPRVHLTGPVTWFVCVVEYLGRWCQWQYDIVEADPRSAFFRK